MGISVGESAVLKACLDLLRSRGVLAWRNNSGALKVDGRYVRFGHAGSSDILGILPWGRFLAIEVKSPGVPAIGKAKGRTSAAQAGFLADVGRNRGVGVVVHDVSMLDGVLDCLFNDPWCDLRLDGIRKS